jgi:hypothetical protein
MQYQFVKRQTKWSRGWPLVARDAQFEGDGIVWQIFSTRWSELEGVTLLYYDVEGVSERLETHRR